ncbi:MAG: ABC transporter permease subunit [Candidatus Poribacteria bacterium]|nr:ABC transporter permease subunit [Candidatus Poribacteria bacterium]
MNQSNKHRRVQKKIFIGIGYPLLIVAAFCTMVPLLWLLSSSFKTADEVFTVPIRWFPKLPPRVTSSPYVVTNTYPKITKPNSVDSDVWQNLQSELEQTIWKNVQEHIAENPQFASSAMSEDLQTEMIKGLWQQHVVPLSPEVWNGTTESIVKTVESSIIPETIETILNSVYRQVKLGTIEIEDIEFNRMEVEATKWEADSDTLQQIQDSDVLEPITALSYDYQDKNNVRLTTTISSPVPIDRIRRIILPVRGDASYHHLSLNVSANGTTYQPTHPFVLDTALQQDTTWRLHGIPGELESSHILMQRIETNDETVKPDVPFETDAENRLILQLTIHRPGYLLIVWNKLTSNYRNLWQTVPYNRYFINSVFIATASTLLTLFFCSLGGYAFAKYQFRGKTILFGILLASMMVPFQVLLVPLFGLMYDIGWLNSYKAIIIPFSVGAFGVFLMRQFIVTIPSELLDAARIDGCSEFGIYYRIVLPIIKPALGALTIYSFLSSWNGYLWPLIVLRDEAKYTLPIGLANLIGIYRQDYGMLMAGTLLSLLPIVILFLAMQREFVQGITLGSVKE